MRSSHNPQPALNLGDDPDPATEIGSRLAASSQTVQGLLTNYLFYGQRRAVDRDGAEARSALVDDVMEHRQEENRKSLNRRGTRSAALRRGGLAEGRVDAGGVVGANSSIPSPSKIRLVEVPRRIGWAHPTAEIAEPAPAVPAPPDPFGSDALADDPMAQDPLKVSHDTPGATVARHSRRGE